MKKKALGEPMGVALLWVRPDEATLDERMKQTQKMLEAGADPDERLNGMTAIELCALRGWIEPMRMLVKAGASLSMEGHPSALMMALKGGQSEAARWLIEQGASVSEANGQGEDALMMAAELNDERTVRELLKRGATSRAKDKRGFGAIERAAQVGALEAIKAIVEVEGFESDKKKEVALKAALIGRQPEVVVWMIKNGAPISWEENGKKRHAIIEAMADCDLEKEEWEELRERQGTPRAEQVWEIGSALWALVNEGRLEQQKWMMEWLESAREEAMTLTALSVCAGHARQAGDQGSEALASLEAKSMAIMERMMLGSEVRKTREGSEERQTRLRRRRP